MNMSLAAHARWTQRGPNEVQWADMLPPSSPRAPPELTYRFLSLSFPFLSFLFFLLFLLFSSSFLVLPFLSVSFLFSLFLPCPSFSFLFFTFLFLCLSSFSFLSFHFFPFLSFPFISFLFFPSLSFLSFSFLPFFFPSFVFAFFLPYCLLFLYNFTVFLLYDIDVSANVIKWLLPRTWMQVGATFPGASTTYLWSRSNFNKCLYGDCSAVWSTPRHQRFNLKLRGKDFCPRKS